MTVVDDLWLRLETSGDQPLLVCLHEAGVIGRDLRSDLVIDDSEASRMHARVTPTANGWTLTDLATTNGTFVNSERISGTVPIHVGDVIGIGRATCTVVPTSAPPMTESAAGSGSRQLF